MRKPTFDYKYLKICLYALFVIFSSILFYSTISSLTQIKFSVGAFFAMAQKILSPFIFGLFIAYFLNPPVRYLEQKVLKSVNLPPRMKRVICAMVAIVAFTGLLVLVIAFILPEVVDSLYSLIMSLPETITNAQMTLEGLIENSNNDYFNIVNDAMEQFTQQFTENYGNISEVATTVVGKTLLFGKGIFNFIIGLIIAFYMLIYKDGFKAYWTRILYVIMSPERAEKFIINCGRANKIFEGFFVGKTLDSAIIGMLCFTIMSLFIHPRYVLLSSVIIGITNMIPFFGPFIGAIPVIILNMFYDMKMAAIVAVFILLLQQFDGYILGPKILGDSTGLTPFWVISAILISGALFGFFGMFLGVPVFAAFKMFFDESIDRQFENKYRRRV